MDQINFYLFIAFFLGGAIGYWLGRYSLKELKERVSLERKAYQEKIQFLQESQQHLSEKFKALSYDVLKQSQETFFQLANETFEKYIEQNTLDLSLRQKAISEIVKPVKESLEKFDAHVGNLEKERIGAYSGLKEQINMLLETQKQLRQETGNLVRALRTPGVRGRWGEIQLKRVVELAGMLDHCDFFEQPSVTDDEKRFRPDLLVRLPGKRNIIIDAKAPLEAYLEAIEMKDEEGKKLKMQDHARHIRQHLLALGKKTYWDQFQPSPEFVVLFLPGEIFFSAALEQDPSLIELGVDQKVVLATPTTLIALLRSVAYGWRQEVLSKNAEHIGVLGKDLYKRLSDMASHWSKLGKSLEGAVEAYNKAVGSLESRVLVSARKFKEADWIGIDKDIEPIDPIEMHPRALQAPEMNHHE